MTAATLNRVLVANRGEIAVRVIRACRALGIESVAIYSDADRTAPHVSLADDAVWIGPEPATESYLAIDRVIQAARSSKADALHPGYGFLSENPEFVRAVVAAGLTFVGPSADAMVALGDKARAKQLAAAADVPVVPSWEPDSVPDDAYPIVVKAAAGGGGRGMRVVESPEHLEAALESAGREALAGFGDDTLIVEKLVVGARHVEVQLLADSHGNALAIGERDCSLQRRHQKVVEEAPAFELSPELRSQLASATERLAVTSGYENAGTAEFLVTAAGDFYFLELNARLQVEHPVTEEAFGLDLAEWQLRIAAGEPLSVPANLSAQRHAIEARVYAEDPVTLLPTGGQQLAVHLPTSRPWLRIDHALKTGNRVSLAYDPLLAKIITTGDTRDEARIRLLEALSEFALPGVVTNVPLLMHALTLPDFVAATHTIETLEHEPLTEAAAAIPPSVEREGRRLQLAGTASSTDPFVVLAGTPVDAPTAGEVRITPAGPSIWVSWHGTSWELPRDHIAEVVGVADVETAGDHAALVAPMPGTILSVKDPGEFVHAGEAVVVLEAMKMENAIAAPFDGTVETIGCSIGQMVTKGTVVAEVTR